ncbi:hypothetical protein JVT61DRAFT_4693 [Boletus reticuloceps]|uniref:Uncharacterized protein n=1 Tax=Boletus reticuloceps TaxID=495285 RepID=A0A8I2YMU5_9AGAM|nr:hypothetical protein JVT61DRAFT_4693 [Boletus reticuloceps]
MVGCAQNAGKHAHLFVSRSTAVGLYGIAIASSSYPSFCGWVPSPWESWLRGPPAARGDYYNGIACRLSLTYWSISVFLNTTLTYMICYRVVRHGRKVREYLGYEYASLYFAVFSIVVESVLPYTLSGVTFLVTLGVGSPTSTAFISVYFLMMCISPQMLILRVMLGKSWDNDTFSRPGSTIEFSPEDTSGSQYFESSRVRVRLQTPSNVYLPGGHGKVRFSEA